MEVQVELISNVTAAATVSDKLSTSAVIITLLLLITFFLLQLFFFIFYHGGGGGRLRAQTYRSCSKTAVSGNSQLLCTVCLHNINDGERYRKLPECNHCFHVDCIDTWFEFRSTCPLCRNQVFDHRNRDRHRRGLIGYLLSLLWIIFSKICRYLDVDVTCDD